MTLTAISIQRLYRQTEQEYHNMKAHGYTSIANELVDTLANLEDIYASIGYDVNDLALTDSYEQLANELDSLPKATYNDYMDYYAGLDRRVI